jgi:hypothetical protein
VIRRVQAIVQLGIALSKPRRTEDRRPRFLAAQPSSSRSAAVEGEADSVSLSKAPQRGLGADQYAEGYKSADFPGNGAYFGLGENGRAIAESYAVHYGEGVIETRIPADI